MEQIISSHAGEDYIDRKLLIYDYRIYLWTVYDDVIETYALDGSSYKALDVPDIPMGLFFFEKDCLYHGAITEEDEGGDCWSIYRYDLKTGKAKELTDCAMGPFFVRDGWVYYTDDAIVRTDGKRTESLLSDDNIVSGGWDYCSFRNYLLYIKNSEDENPEDGIICAYNLDSGREYELFDMSGIGWGCKHYIQPKTAYSFIRKMTLFTVSCSKTVWQGCGS